MIPVEVILGECLDALLEGATVEQCLARYPDRAGELAPLLRLAVQIEQTPPLAISPAGYERGRNRARAAVAALRAGQAVAVAPRASRPGRSHITHLLGRQFNCRLNRLPQPVPVNWFETVLLAGMALVIVAFIVLSSPANSPFYPARQAIERLWLTVQPVPEPPVIRSRHTPTPTQTTPDSSPGPTLAPTQPPLLTPAIITSPAAILAPAMTTPARAATVPAPAPMNTMALAPATATPVTLTPAPSPTQTEWRPTGTPSPTESPTPAQVVELLTPTLLPTHTPLPTDTHAPAATLAPGFIPSITPTRTPIPVPSATTTVVPTPVVADGAIEGRVVVTDQAGAAPTFLARLSVWAERPELRQPPGQRARVPVNPDGRYRLEGLEPGTYLVYVVYTEDPQGQFPVAVQYFDGVTSIDRARPVTVIAGQTNTGVDFSLPSTQVPALGLIRGQIAGTAADGTQIPLGEVVVEALLEGDVGWNRTAISAADGTYRLENLFPGTYVIRASDPAGQYATAYYSSARQATQFYYAERVKVKYASETSGINFVLSRTE